MGYIVHHALIITTPIAKWIKPLRKAALQISRDIHKEMGWHSQTFRPQNMITTSIHAPVNGYQTLFVGPDGSKRGVPEDEAGEMFRQRLIRWMREFDGQNGKSDTKGDCFTWALVQYGDDDRDNRMLDDDAKVIRTRSDEKRQVCADLDLAEKRAYEARAELRKREKEINLIEIRKDALTNMLDPDTSLCPACESWTCECFPKPETEKEE